MKIKEIMTATALKHCSPDHSIREAAQQMKSGNCGALPVVDNEKHVIGIVTDRDIAISLADEPQKSLTETSVRDIMSSKVFMVQEDDELETALGKMRINQVGRLPVVNKSKQLKGIVSIHNLLSSLNDDLSLNRSGKSENLAKTLSALSERYRGEKSNKRH